MSSDLRSDLVLKFLATKEQLPAECYSIEHRSNMRIVGDEPPIYFLKPEHLLSWLKKLDQGARPGSTRVMPHRRYSTYPIFFLKYGTGPDQERKALPVAEAEVNDLLSYQGEWLEACACEEPTLLRWIKEGTSTRVGQVFEWYIIRRCDTAKVLHLLLEPIDIFLSGAEKA